MSASASQYKLVGGNKDDLRRYVNSQVEITGRVDDSASSSGGAMGGGATGAGSTATGTAAGTSATGSTATGSTATGTATGSTATGSTASGSASRASDAGPTLNVDSVRQISPSCSAQ